MSTRNIFCLGVMAMLAGCTGQVGEPGVPAAKDTELYIGDVGGCSSPTGCGTGNGTGVYYEELGSAGIDSLHLMITHFTNTSDTNGTYVAVQGRYQDTTTSIWYYLPTNGARVVRAFYNGVAYRVVGVGESSTNPYFTLQDSSNDAPFSVYGYYFPNLKIDIATSTPVDGQWELSFLPSTSGQQFGSDNEAEFMSPSLNIAPPVVYKWDMYWQNLKTLAPPAPYCQRAPQVDSGGNKATPDDYVVFQKGIDVDPVTGSVTSSTVTANDVTMSCRYGAIATAYLWGYNYTTDLWHYASAIHMKRASYCGDASFYTVSGTLIDMQDETPIEDALIVDANVEAFWTPTGAFCYNGPRRGGLSPAFSGSCNGTQKLSCNSVDWATYDANASTTQLADGATVFNGKLYLFAIGISDHQHYVNVFNGSSWTGWSVIPGGGATSQPDAAVVFNSELYLFAVGTSDHAHYMNTFNGTSWSGWRAVPGGGTTMLADAAAAYNSKLYLFGIAISDSAHYMNTFDGTSWSGWSAVPGGGTTAQPDAAVVSNNKLNLIAVGTNDHAVYTKVFDGSTWSGWNVVSGVSTQVALTATDLAGALHLFAVATNQHHFVNIGTGSFGGWQEVPGGGASVVADASATYLGNVYLFGIGVGDHAHYVNVKSAGVWSGWRAVPGGGANVHLIDAPAVSQ